MDEESEALFDKVDIFDEICENQPFKCYDATSEQDINGLFEFMSKIESSLTCNDDITQVQLMRHKELINFIKTHYYESTIYITDNPDHYSSFHTVYGTETSKEFCPTLQINQTNTEPVPKGVLIRDYVTCCDCEKWRCIFSDKALSQKEMQDFKQALDAYDYSCDAPLFSDDYYLIEVLFIYIKIFCDTPIEILYYSSQKSGNFDICYYCGADNNLIDPPSTLIAKYKIVYTRQITDFMARIAKNRNSSF
ncbi:hypothetical protein GLOIN_2v1785492 [Rhizophagus irregularis DAOM 181602=DAOM 197198]|uniref:Uncharacterized protein n=1 Tax=Rhizophagus irregularis (strain DAOM 181602 / DAOM 197198 / MUCL 43194) TaxID=747089 RepID=A0A2P4PA85_RHIID|nr:hypothetical protein GLOIN_2v1785492 [Rhizophagus irregularis DAOM 181602=DAOM 197198]POG62294.1 hypothetical protein GLOIN_2v1785492 [Rhizophagus irregularis DAOM 181602=DAOM 197198]|eukprot:XP_025169160.1 hypothetical protein GLOIN_2v1785492 [Rhizophagus irregularis DAOM 181602=DAOM 197198]